VERLVKLALERLDDLDLEQKFLDSRKATRAIIANSFVTNLEIIRKLGTKEENKSLDLYFFGTNITFQKFIIQNFPWVNFPGSEEVALLGNFGLIKLLTAQGMSQAEIGRRLGVSKVMVTYWLQDKRELKVRHFFRIMELAGKEIFMKNS